MSWCCWMGVGCRLPCSRAGPGIGCGGGGGGRRRGSCRALIVHAVGHSLHQGLSAGGVGGGAGGFEHGERSDGGGALAGEVHRGGRWCWWRRGRRGRSTLRVVLGERSRAGLRRGLGGEQRPLAAVGGALGLRLGREEEGGSGVEDRRGGQRGGMQLGGSQRSRFGSRGLARRRRRLAGRIRRPGPTVAVFLLRRPTGRRSDGSGRAGLREESEKESHGRRRLAGSGRPRAF